MHLTVATAGHIDHGKSALVQALTGTNPDRLPEEQARGISIELGFAHTQVGETTLSFVDVPGHERFVRTMLAGVGGIDAVLLVVAADESVMPQTREHVAICRLLDVPTGVIALTRCDLADETMQTIAEDEIRALVAGTPLAAAPIVRTSARTGEGLDALVAAIVRCASGGAGRDRSAPARLPIDRVFTVRGFGTVVTGTLWSGSLVPEQPLLLIDATGESREVRVRGLQVHGSAAVRADAGQRTAVNLAGVAHQDVQRGDVLAQPHAVMPTRRLLVDVTVLPEAPPQRHGARVHVHLGTTAVLGRILLPRDAEGGETRSVGSGRQRRALLRLETPLAARRGDRLVLRSYSPVTTVAGATVVDPQPSSRRGVAEGTDGADVMTWLEGRVEDAGPVGVRDEDVPARAGVPVGTASRLVEALLDRGATVKIGHTLVATSALRRLRERVLATIDAAAAADPLAGGVPRATLHGMARRHWTRGLVEHVIAGLLAEGALQGEDRLARAQAVPQRAAADLQVLAIVEATGLKGVTAGELDAQLAGLDRKALAAVVGRLVREREVERLGDLLVAAGHLRALAAELRALAIQADAPPMLEVGWFKERYGLTRKAAIPLLEWLDRARVTRRQGDARRLVVPDA